MGNQRERGEAMGFKKKSGLLVGAGFLLGTVGVKALTSTTAKKCYVQGVAQGLRAKATYENIVEQAKAEVDDIVAEAIYNTSGRRIDQMQRGINIVRTKKGSTRKIMVK